DVQALSHASVVALDALAFAAQKPDQLEHLVDAHPLGLAAHAVQLGEIAEVVETGEPLVEPALAAEYIADPLADLARLADDVVPEHARVAGRRQQQRDQHLDRRRLAGAVRAEQPEELALGDLERDPADGL